MSDRTPNPIDLLIEVYGKGMQRALEKGDLTKARNICNAYQRDGMNLPEIDTMRGFAFRISMEALRTGMVMSDEGKPAITVTYEMHSYTKLFSEMMRGNLMSMQDLSTGASGFTLFGIRFKPRN